MNDLNVFMPLTKVDAVQRLVYLTMTAERPDKSREVMDYATGKPQIQKWSDEIKAASDGHSLGNVRLMHGKDPIGKLTDLVFDDENKTVDCCVKVVSDAAWKLVEERVLTGGSIGGSYLKTWADPADRTLKRYTPQLAEFSLVDNPCLPEATFRMVKADGVEEDLHFAKQVQAFEPASDDVKALAEELAKGSGKPDRRNDFVAKARAELIKRHADEPEPQPEPAETGAEPTTVDLLKAAIEKAAGSPKPYGDVEYADPKAGKYPIDTPAHIRAAWSYVNMPKNAAKLADDADAVKAKIVAAWKAKIDKDGPPSAEKAAFIGDLLKSGAISPLLKAMETVGLEKGFYTVGRTAHLLNHMSEIAQGVIWEEAWEKDEGSTLPQAILDLMASTRSFLIDMVNEETAEFFAQAEQDGGDSIALLAPCLDVDGMEMELSAKAAELQKLHKADEALLAKIGAKISSSNMKHVQAMHDHAQAMGATCDSGNCDKSDPTGDLAKVDPAELETLRKLAGEAVVTIDKITGERAEDRATIEKMSGELATAQATLEKLGSVVDLISRQPQPAKGALFAIEKDGSVTPMDRNGAPVVVAKSIADEILAAPEGPERAAILLKYSGGGQSR